MDHPGTMGNVDRHPLDIPARLGRSFFEQLPATNIKAVNTKQKWILFFIFLYFVFNKIDQR